MLNKILVTMIALLSFCSLGGVFLAGLNMYTRSTILYEGSTVQQTEPQKPPQK